MRLSRPMLAIALLAAVTAACSTPTPAQPPTTGTPSLAAPNSPRVIEYQVEGIAPILAVTYATFNDGHFGALTVFDAATPWKMSVEVPARFTQAGLSVATAQLNGDVTCRIVSGGKVLAENHASGMLAVASCTANFDRLPPSLTVFTRSRVAYPEITSSRRSAPGLATGGHAKRTPRRRSHG